MVKGAQASSLSDFSIERPTLIKNVVPPATVPSQQAAKAALRAARKTGNRGFARHSAGQQNRLGVCWEEAVAWKVTSCHSEEYRSKVRQTPTSFPSIPSRDNGSVYDGGSETSPDL